MAIIATDTPRFSAVVKYELSPEQAVCRDVVTYNGTAVALPVGAVLGKVTATGKYKLVEATANDGSQVAAAVYIGSVTGIAHTITPTLNTDTPLLVLSRGPAIVAASALVFGASVTAGALNAAALAQLKALGIQAETTI